VDGDRVADLGELEPVAQVERDKLDEQETGVGGTQIDI